VELHCNHLPASTMVHYSKQHTMSTSANGATVVFGTGPSGGFAAALIPDLFDGSNYKRWRARMILWLTAMSCYHATKGKPEQFTPEEEQTFMGADN